MSWATRLRRGARAIPLALPPAILVLAGTSGNVEGSWKPGDASISKKLLMIIAAGVLTGLEVVITRRRSKQLDRAGRATQAESTLMALIRAELRSLQEQARHYSNNRVSVYIHSGDHFSLVSRRSPDPNLDRSPGRIEYPENEGCLARAWADGIAQDLDLPKPGNAPTPNAQWIRAQQRWGVPDEVSTTLRMRSRSYAAIRIMRLDGDRALGVVVFESLLAASEMTTIESPPLMSCDQLKPLLDSAALRLARILEALEAIPETERAEYLIKLNRI